MFETGWLSGDPGFGRFLKLQIGSFIGFLFLDSHFLSHSSMVRVRDWLFPLTDSEYEELTKFLEKSFIKILDSIIMEL